VSTNPKTADIANMGWVLELEIVVFEDKMEEG